MRRIRFLSALLACSTPLLAQSPQPAPGISTQALDRAAPDLPTDIAAARPVRARHAMVVSDQHLATDVGVKILKEGGNAVDAAVAVGYALAVTDPCCGNIGGGGFMLIHLADGKNLFLDFREKAPGRATATLFQDSAGNVIPDESIKSWRAIGVPGTVMGLNEALARYGTMSRKQVMAPAIALAKRGFVLVPGDVKVFASRNGDFAKEPNVAAIFLNKGQPRRAGERLVQAKLAHTLQMVSDGGSDAFYKGSIASAVVAASDASGGLFMMKDFADYTVRWDEPVRCAYRGYRVIAAPPPSSGGVTVCEILNTISGYPLKDWGYGSVQATHYIVEAERRAFADRNELLGDPAFVRNPVARLTSPEHAAQLRAGISPDRATPSGEIHGTIAPGEETETTHYSVVDAHGNAVAVTYTINFLFGVGKIAGDTGFFLNDELDDFTAKPGVANGFGLVQGKRNAVAGGKRPLSSMSPTILLHADGKPFMVTGSPGGSTIITTVVQSIVNVIDFGMNMQQAVDAPRFHHQWMPDQIMVQPGYLIPANQAALEAMGHRFDSSGAWGADEAILIDPATGMLQGANDRRRPAGLAAGY